MRSMCRASRSSIGSGLEMTASRRARAFEYSGRHYKSADGHVRNPHRRGTLSSLPLHSTNSRTLIRLSSESTTIIMSPDSNIAVSIIPQHIAFEDSRNRDRKPFERMERTEGQCIPPRSEANSWTSRLKQRTFNIGMNVYLKENRRTREDGFAVEVDLEAQNEVNNWLHSPRIPVSTRSLI